MSNWHCGRHFPCNSKEKSEKMKGKAALGAFLSHALYQINKKDDYCNQYVSSVHAVLQLKQENVKAKQHVIPSATSVLCS